MLTEHCREPIEIIAGDTLHWFRDIGHYRPADGWSLIYELRGGSQPIEFTSVASATRHEILVAASVTATWLPGDYVLQGFAVNSQSDPPERHQIFYADCPVRKNLQGSAGDVDVKTFKQKVLEAAENSYLKLMQTMIVESDVEGTRILRERREHAHAAYAQAYSDRQNEIAIERAKNGQPTGEVIKPRLLITTQSNWPFGLRGPYGIGTLT